MPEQQQVEPRKGREGGRWINERPTSEEFAAWFHENMKIDEALNAADYMGGVVLIPAVDTKAKTVTGFNNRGKPIIEEGDELSYIPYAKVETRINYFWDLLAAHAEEWVAFIEGVDLDRIPLEVNPSIQTVEEEGGKKTITQRPTRPDALTSLVHQLPLGYSISSVPVGNGFTHFLCSTTLVEVYDRAQLDVAVERCVKMAVAPEEIMRVARSMCPPLRKGRATKQVPMLMGRSTPWADPSSMMKAETGALGRALGFAGIFVIPGSGVATAEDMQEALSQGSTPPQEAPSQGNQGPAAPDVTPVRTGAEQAQDEEGQLKARAAELWKKLGEDHPGKATEFGEWAQSRNLRNLSEAKGAMLKGVVKKLEKLNDEAEQASQQAALPIPEPTPVVPEHGPGVREHEGGESDGDATAPSAESSGQAD